MKNYHYIFTGTGLAALMTVYKMVQSGNFKDKTILLIDEDSKKSNDRTWCYWEQSKGKWDKIISMKWNRALYANEAFSRSLDLQPYQYKMIKGLDFYNKIFKRISKETNITFLNQNVIGYSESADGVVVQTTGGDFSCDKLLNSIYDPSKILAQKKYPLLQQHFIGWFIQSEQLVFNPNQLTFMDFSVAQKGNTRFMYILPTSNTQALIEYTLFSKDLLAEAEYEDEIKTYIANLGIKDYTIIEKEQGSIPMTSYPFWKNNTQHIINIGSAGGWTKASTGFTFKNSDKKSDALVGFLNSGTDFRKFHKTNKFWFYDLLLLDILDQKNEKGSLIFSSLFKKGNPAVIFKFLDEQTSFLEDIRVILKCPTLLFLKALVKRVF